MASGVSEKKASPRVIDVKSNQSPISGNEDPLTQNNDLHYVSRNEDSSLHEYDGETIPGYNADLMRARASLSSVEEKKLLRRVDWHLIPLLAVIYMVKSVDFTNVCQLDFALHELFELTMI